MKKALLGLSNNIFLNKEKIKLWVTSFKLFCDYDIILLAANINDNDKMVCDELNIKYEVVTIDDTWYINHKRLNYVSDFLKKSNIDIFLITDVFDVVFQNDPFNKFDLDKYDIFVSGEGLNVNQEPWNSDNIKKLFPNDFDKCQHEEVICSGIIGGKRTSLIKLYDRMYQLCELTNNEHNIKDQAALIVMIANKEIENLKIFNLDDGWAMHCAVSGPTQFFESWGFKNNLKYGHPKMFDGVVKTFNDKIFDIVHQFNRVPEWHKILLKKII